MFLFHASKMILALYLIKMCGHVTITDDNTDDQLLEVNNTEDCSNAVI